jgi:hypothetical protein
MLGEILGPMTEADSAEAMLASLGRPGILARVREGARAEGLGAGAFVAARIRHVLDHAGDEVWLDLLGRMSGSPEPGLAALEILLLRAFPDERPPQPPRVTMATR